MLAFEMDNAYSWLREKVVSYRITVTPPSADILMSGRRRRAKACQTVVEEDLSSAQERLAATLAQKTTLEQEIAKLEKELEEKKKSLEVAEKEEKWLITRVKLRREQGELLKKRLTEGWEDERSED
jgi:chromosome segregation ATPase